MGWREAFLKYIGPGGASGLKLGDWMRLLADNRFRVAWYRTPKAAMVTLCSLINSSLGAVEGAMYGRRIAAQTVAPPLFILGHFRSGTTHLQNLFAHDSRFATPRFSEVMVPHTFLLGEPVMLTLGKRLMPPTRLGADNVAFYPRMPHEDEFGLFATTLMSPYLGWMFPQRMEQYERYFTFRDVPPEDLERWRGAFLTLLKKLTWKYQRPLILKSPTHTARIRILLEMFPDAKFIHIHRDPYVVYQSTQRIHRTAWEYFHFQRADPGAMRPCILRQYRLMYDAYFAERHLIPADRFCEVTYAELDHDALGTLRRIYERLALPDISPALPELEAYVASISGYRKNQHPELPADVRAEIAREWRQSFEEWGYAL